MVHELKSPVAAARMTVDVAEHPKPEPEKLREFMGRIGNRTGRLSEMIADLVDLARVQSGDAIGEVDPVVVSPDVERFGPWHRLKLIGRAAGRILEPVEPRGFTPQEVEERRMSSFWMLTLDEETVPV